jgi:hypothetical protein
MINPVISPRHYSFSVLTPEVKTAVINKLVEHAAYLNNETKIGSSGIDSLIEMVKSAQFSQQDLDDLKRVTNTIDNIRNEKLLDAIPEIQPLFK